MHLSGLWVTCEYIQWQPYGCGLVLPIKWQFYGRGLVPLIKHGIPKVQALQVAILWVWFGPTDEENSHVKRTSKWLFFGYALVVPLKKQMGMNSTSSG